MTKTGLDLAAVAPEGQPGGNRAEEFFALLAERTGRYTMDESSSVRAETAARLLEGILYCLRLSPQADSDAPIKERFLAGVGEAKRLKRRAALLYAQAKRWPPPVVNLAYSETLSALSDFFRSYDPDFFAQDIPCTIDYPLCRSVYERLAGVTYVLGYLRRWLLESALLNALDADLLKRLYAGYYGDYDGLLVNLCLPAAESATLCALAGRPAKELFLDAAGRKTVSSLILSTDEETARQAVEKASRRACEELGQSGAFAQDYFGKTAQDLLTRLRAAGEVQPEE